MLYRSGDERAGSEVLPVLEVTLSLARLSRQWGKETEGGVTPTFLERSKRVIMFFVHK
jgi:hypothetical protein